VKFKIIDMLCDLYFYRFELFYFLSLRNNEGSTLAGLLPSTKRAAFHTFVEKFL